MTLRAKVAENLPLNDDVHLEPVVFSAAFSANHPGDDTTGDEMYYAAPTSAMKLGEVHLQQSGGAESNEAISACDKTPDQEKSSVYGAQPSRKSRRVHSTSNPMSGRNPSNSDLHRESSHQLKTPSILQPGMTK